MEIKNKTDHDPVLDLPMIEGFMRWALIAAEEMMGKESLEFLLRENELAQFIDNYPPAKMKLSQHITVKEHATLSTALTKFYGSDGINELIRFGRISTRPALESQGKLFTMTTKTALKLLPMSAQIKLVLEGVQSDLEKAYKQGNYEVGVSVEDRGDSWAYIDRCCAFCAGNQSEEPICWGWVGSLEESLHWLIGKEFQVKQVACRAMGAPACVWEVNKTPKQ